MHCINGIISPNGLDGWLVSWGCHSDYEASFRRGCDTQRTAHDRPVVVSLGFKVCITQQAVYSISVGVWYTSPGWFALPNTVALRNSFQLTPGEGMYVLVQSTVWLRRSPYVEEARRVESTTCRCAVPEYAYDGVGLCLQTPLVVWSWPVSAHSLGRLEVSVPFVYERAKEEPQVYCLPGTIYLAHGLRGCQAGDWLDVRCAYPCTVWVVVPWEPNIGVLSVSTKFVQIHCLLLL